MWDTKALKQPPTVYKHEGDIRALVFFADSRRLASAGCDGKVQIRTVEGKLEKAFEMPGGVTALAVAGEGRYLLTGNGNGTVYVLRLPAGPR